ncbi:MinD/ParA family protein [Microbacterium sp. YY-01]|uniref:MinD/ParA family ATP-binding protein n=1 Tax=Microbacterium sp. YY-01 TaxID=3421634 RepID=UPI003D17FD76
MTSDRLNPVSDDHDPLDISEDAASVDAATINLLGNATAQVSVVLPESHDELDDDDVVEDEVIIVPAHDESLNGHDNTDHDDAEPGEVDRDDDVVDDSADTAEAERSDAAEGEDSGAGGDGDPVDTSVDGNIEVNADDSLHGADVGAAEGSVAEDSVGEDDPFAFLDLADDTATEPDAAVESSEPEVSTTPPDGAGQESADETGVEVTDEATDEGADEVADAVNDADSDDAGHGAFVAEVVAALSTGAVRVVNHARADEDIEDAVVVDADETITPAPVGAQKAEVTVVNNDSTPSSRPDIHLASKRLNDLGERDREGADRLTADRLLDPHHQVRPEPEGMWQQLLYTLTRGKVNLGDSRAARQRKELTSRISAALPGGAHFVPVLSRKGGVGKTTVTALLGMAMADAREDRVVAVDANPDRGTLADRVERPSNRTVRDLVRIHDQVHGFADISAIVSRDATRLDVLASDSDPHVSEAFGDEDYRKVADVAARFYSLVLTDTGTGIVHSVMDATLNTADQLVVVAGLSVDQARLASETLTWLETNGHRDLARSAVVVLNQVVPGASPVRVEELESHFASRVRAVVRVPYDASLASGSSVGFAALRPETRRAARELAAAVVDGLRSGNSS